MHDKHCCHCLYTVYCVCVTRHVRLVKAGSWFSQTRLSNCSKCGQEVTLAQSHTFCVLLLLRETVLMCLCAILSVCDLPCPRVLPPHPPALSTSIPTQTGARLPELRYSHPLAAGIQHNHGNKSLTPGEMSNRTERLHSISTSPVHQG